MANRFFRCTHSSCLVRDVAIGDCIGLGRARARRPDRDTLAAADKELKSGNYQLSITHADNAIASGKLAPADLARGLYIRGSSYLAAGRTSQAIVDLNAALWMKKLPPRLQKDAKAKRYQAYTNVGVAPRESVAGRPGRSVSTISSGATAPKQTPARASAASGGHKVALPVERQTRLPEGTHTRPLVLNAKAQNTRPKTIVAPLPVTQTTPQWSATTRQAVRPPPARRSATIAPARQPSRAPVTAPPRAAPVKRATAAPARNRVSAGQPVQPTARTAVRPFSTQTRVAPRQPSVTTRQAAPTLPARRPVPASEVAAVQPAAVAPPDTPPARRRSSPSFGVRDGIYDNAPPPAPAPAAEPASIEEPVGGSSFLGSIFGGAEPKSDDILAADELQRRRTERIREHNRRLTEEQ